MKSAFALLFILFLVPLALHAQLTIESVNGKGRSKTIRLGTKIGLQMPTATTNNDCNCCFHKFIGILDSTNAEYMVINLKSTERAYTDIDGIFKKVSTEFQDNASAPTSLPLNSIQSISAYRKTPEVLDKLGATLMLLAGFQALFFNPLVFEGKERKQADAIAAGAFGLGLTFVLVPNKKIYRFEPSTGGSGKLWRLKNQ